MSKKIVMLLVMMLLVPLALTACGGVDEDSPEGVVDAFFGALKDEEESDVLDLLCKDYRQNVAFDIDDDDDVKLRFDLRYDVDGEDGDDVTDLDVKVWGTVDARAETEHEEMQVKVKRDREQPWKVKLFKVDDEWKVCGGDVFLMSLLDFAAMTGGSADGGDGH